MLFVFMCFEFEEVTSFLRAIEIRCNFCVMGWLGGQGNPMVYNSDHLLFIQLPLFYRETSYGMRLILPFKC